MCGIVPTPETAELPLCAQDSSWEGCGGFPKVYVGRPRGCKNSGRTAERSTPVELVNGRLEYAAFPQPLASTSNMPKTLL